MKDSAAARFLASSFPNRRGWLCVVDAEFNVLAWVKRSRRDAVEQIERLAQRPGRARIYVSTFRSPTNRRTGNVLESRLVMVDADDSRAWGEANPAPPIVLASRTEGNAHPLWPLDESVSPAELTRLNRGQRDLLDGDPGFGLGATATVWLPRDHDDLLVFQPDRVIRPFELRQRHRPCAVPKVPPRAIRDSSPADRAASGAMAISRALAAVSRGGSRNDTGWRLACDLWSRGLSEDEARKAGERYVEQVEWAKPLDEPYELAEWEDQVNRRFKNGPAAVDPEHIAHVDSWETCWLTNPRYGSSQKTMLSAVAGLFRAAGTDEVELSRRQAMIFARLSRGAVDRGFDGSKTRDGLIGTCLQLLSMPTKGSKSGCVFQLVDPPTPPDIPIANTRSLPLGLVLSPPVKPSPTVPENHDAFRVTGHGPRLVLDVLLSLDRPASIADLVLSPVLSDHKRTIRRQLQRLEEHGLVTRSADAQWQAVTEDLQAVLDLVAEETERPNAEGRFEPWSERTHRQNVEARRAYERGFDPVQRKRKEADQLRRVCQRRARRRPPGRGPRRRHLTTGKLETAGPKFTALANYSPSSYRLSSPARRPKNFNPATGRHYVFCCQN